MRIAHRDATQLDARAIDFERRVEQRYSRITLNRDRCGLESGSAHADLDELFGALTPKPAAMGAGVGIDRNFDGMGLAIAARSGNEARVDEIGYDAAKPVSAHLGSGSIGVD